MKPSFLDRISESLISAMSDYNKEDVISQQLVIFPDKNAEWIPLINRLRKTLPIITIGEYDPSSFTGPAIYIRSLVFQIINSTSPEGKTPVIYLPGYSREQLRNLEDCPDEIKPLAGLQYLGEIWSQRNGRDWTLLAFLKSNQGGLGLAINDDLETREAVKNAASVLADETIEFLKSKEPLNASFFDDLHHADPVRQLLSWMSDPSCEEEKMKGDGDWKSFVKICKKSYEFDPEKDGVATAAEKLGMQGGKWQEVWKRFEEKPLAYSHVPILLRSVTLPNWLPYPDSWPQLNEAQEIELGKALIGIEKSSPLQARNTILDLEKIHAERRKWVWAQMGESPLARALEHLSSLAGITSEMKFGGSVDEQAARYSEDLWKADNAVIQALECANEKTSLNIIRSVIQAIYPTWLNTMVDSFQKAWIAGPPTQNKENQAPVPGEVFLFVDGLRMDLGRRLCEVLQNDGCSYSITYRFSALPTETATAKPAVMPIVGELNAGEKLIPATKSGAVAQITALRTILEERGFAILSDAETGNFHASGWSDCANIDEEGHSKGIELPIVLNRELKRIRDRIIELLDARWEQVRVVTDHGWLLIPGGLPKTELKPALTEIKRSRFAQIRSDANVDLPVVPWFWDRTVRIALAPGISSFEEGKIYAHGGLSPQEVVVPEIIVTRRISRTTGITIGEPTWAGLRCRVRIEGAPGFGADIREQPGDISSSLLSEIKIVDIEGNVSLVVEDDRVEGKTGWLVILDGRKNVVAQREIRIGGEK